MSKAALVDVLGWAAIVLWLGLSGYFLYVGDGEMFQRVGVVGVAAGVAYFTMQRHATPHPYGQIENEAWAQKRLQLLSDKVDHSLERNALLAKALVEDAKKSGSKISTAISALGNVSMEDIDQAINNTTDETIVKIEAQTEKRLSVNTMVERSRRRSEVLQALVVITGTLQSGLGSLLINSN